MYFLVRETSEKNLKKARKYHSLGEKCAQEQKFEDARLNYEIAKTYREKAMKMKGGK